MNWDSVRGALKSKTMWFGLATAALGAADWITGNAGLISTIMPAAGPALTVVGTASMVLRALTTKPLSDK